MSKKKKKTEEYNSSDPKHVQKREQELKLQAIQQIEDMRHTLADPHSRRIIWQILEMCHVFGISFTGNAETHFKEGERNIGLKILGLITGDETCLKHFHKHQLNQLQE